MAYIGLGLLDDLHLLNSTAVRPVWSTLYVNTYSLQNNPLSDWQLVLVLISTEPSVALTDYGVCAVTRVGTFCTRWSSSSSV